MCAAKNQEIETCLSFNLSEEVSTINASKVINILEMRLLISGSRLQKRL